MLWNQCDQALQVGLSLPTRQVPKSPQLTTCHIRPEERIHLKFNDEISVFHVESDLSSKTQKQGEDEEDLHTY